VVHKDKDLIYQQKKRSLFRTELLALSQPVLLRDAGTSAIACDREIPVCVTDMKDRIFKKIE